MSAVNVIASGKEVYLFTDGAWSGPDGRIEILASKVEPVPGANFVVTGRGWGPMLCRLRFALGDAQNLDDAAAALPDLARAILAEAPADVLPAYRQAQLVLAGWSPTKDRMDAQILFSHDQGPLPAWTVASIDRWDGRSFVAPLVADSAPWDGRLTPLKWGLAALRAQRAARASLTPDGPEQPAIGGFGEMTILSKDSRTARVIIRWPEDRVGGYMGAVATVKSDAA